MKKTLYSIFFVSSILFATSCTEDRGTSTEVADANDNEYVDPNHLGGLEDEGLSSTESMSSTGGMDADTDMTHQNRSQEIAEKMASDLKLDVATQDRVASIFYERDKMLSDIDGSYNVSETNRMGGQAGTEAENDLDATSTEAMRDNTATGMAAESETMHENNAELTEMRSTIIEDADKDLRGVLTEEQFKKFEQNRSKYDHVSNTVETSDNSKLNPDKHNNNNPNKTDVKPRN
ncbi:hypothetical protein [Pontibacter beigongshangensis]|uniref:hypothetical protein n=1 Tax=Pontibacter beigongshangensis TaxID=2574733 RepID=UPI0016505852|nr:hypothetical protein [Pontibacter beigongshangensis]